MYFRISRFVVSTKKWVVPKSSQNITVFLKFPAAVFHRTSFNPFVAFKIGPHYILLHRLVCTQIRKKPFNITMV